MNRKVKPISEVIEMACKGFIPLNSEFLYKGEVYGTKHIGKNSTLLFYWNEDDATSIQFQFDESGNLLYVELSPPPDVYDYDEDYILFESRWTDAQKNRAYHDLDSYKSNVYNLFDYKK